MKYNKKRKEKETIFFFSFLLLVFVNLSLKPETAKAYNALGKLTLQTNLFLYPTVYGICKLLKAQA